MPHCFRFTVVALLSHLETQIIMTDFFYDLVFPPCESVCVVRLKLTVRTSVRVTVDSRETLEISN